MDPVGNQDDCVSAANDGAGLRENEVGETSNNNGVRVRRRSLLERRNDTSENLLSLSRLEIPSTPAPENAFPLNFSANCNNNNRNKPTPEETAQEGQELLENFVLEGIQAAHLDVPQQLEIRCKSTSANSLNMACSNANWSSSYEAGRDVGARLRQIAQEFESSPFSSQVRREAEQLDLLNINEETFQGILRHFLDNGISQVQIVVIFTFCRDVAVRALKNYLHNLFTLILKWTVAFLVTHVCQWVQEHGGWNAVLSSTGNFIRQNKMLASVVVGALAIVLYIAFKRYL